MKCKNTPNIQNVRLRETPLQIPPEKTRELYFGFFFLGGGSPAGYRAGIFGQFFEVYGIFCSVAGFSGTFSLHSCKPKVGAQPWHWGFSCESWLVLFILEP